MTREITLVSLIDGDELSINETKSFTDYNKAEKYFIKLIKGHFPESCKDWTDEGFNACLDDGYYQENHFCIYINQITLEADWYGKI